MGDTTNRHLALIVARTAAPKYMSKFSKLDDSVSETGREREREQDNWTPIDGENCKMWQI